MAERSRLNLIFKPSKSERNVPFMARVRFAVMGANSLTPITPESHPELSQMLDEMSNRAGLPTPEAYVWDSKKPVANALAMPARVPIVAFSKPITQILNTEELAAVAGHELGHVKNIRHSGKLFWLAAFGGGALADIVIRPFQRGIRERMRAGDFNPALAVADASMTMARFVAPVIGGAAASRAEEYAADRHGAYTMGEGVTLMSALEKLGEHNHKDSRGVVGKLLTPFGKLAKSHPEYDQRRAALGVSEEQVAAYREANPVTAPAEPQQDWASRVGSASTRGTTRTFSR